MFEMYVDQNFTPESNGSNYALDQHQMRVLAYIGISASIPSILGAGSVVFAAVYNHKLCNANVHPIFHLSLADFLASFCLLISCFLYINKTEHVILFCAFTAAFTKSFFTTTFFLTILYAQQVYARLKQTRKRRYSTTTSHTKSYLFVGLYALAWVVPLLFNVGLVINLKFSSFANIDPVQTPCYSCLPLFHYREDNCTPVRQLTPGWWIARRLVFFLPLVGVMAGNSVVYLLIVREYQHHEAVRGVVTELHHSVTRRITRRSILYQSVFTLCWISSLILGIVTLTPNFKMIDYYVLYVFQSITTPLQGFFNSVVYAWQRKSFTGTLKFSPPPDDLYPSDPSIPPHLVPSAGSTSLLSHQSTGSKNALARQKTPGESTPLIATSGNRTPSYEEQGRNQMASYQFRRNFQYN